MQILLHKLESLGVRPVNLYFYKPLGFCYPKYGTQPNSLVLAGKVLEMQNFGPYPRPTESEYGIPSNKTPR